VKRVQGHRHRRRLKDHRGTVLSVALGQRHAQRVGRSKKKTPAGAGATLTPANADSSSQMWAALCAAGWASEGESMRRTWLAIRQVELVLEDDRMLRPEDRRRNRYPQSTRSKFTLHHARSESLPRLRLGWTSSPALQESKGRCLRSHRAVAVQWSHPGAR